MKEERKMKLVVSAISFKNNVPVEEAKIIGAYIEQLEINWNELKKFIEKEKDRLVRECSQIYEDSLGETKFVNEDIYNELKNISDKMEELESGKNE